LIISGKENTFEVYGLGKITVINEDKTLEFKSGETYDLTTLQNHLSKSRKDKSSEINQETNQNKSDETLRKIANLEIQIEENESNNKIFKELVTQLIDLRLKLRSEKNYEMSDMIRDILESSNIQIEDSTDKIEWKIKD
jgi:Cysteinyl-tRNA synthetase